VPVTRARGGPWHYTLSAAAPWHCTKRNPRSFYRVFELPSPKNALKRDKRNGEKIGFVFFVVFFENLFDTIFWQNVFCCVFELPSL
jgi:hypothetical protein